jgi:hypothetical protein
MKRFVSLLATMVVLLPLFFFNVNAAPPDECLKMLMPNDYHSEYDSTLPGWHDVGTINPDSVRVDSCFDSPTFGKQFAKRYFTIKFVPFYYPFTEVIDSNDVMGINDLSNSRPKLKQQLQDLESSFGKLYIKGMGDEDLIKEEEILSRCLFKIYFETYQDISAVEDYVSKNIDSVTFFKYENRAGALLNIEDRLNYSYDIEVEPIPSSYFIRIHVNETQFTTEKLEIFNSNGIRIIELPFNEEINISNISNGVYFIKYGTQIGKFIKE